jgi:hypothetical protein
MGQTEKKKVDVCPFMQKMRPLRSKWSLGQKETVFDNLKKSQEKRKKLLNTMCLGK